MHPNPAFRTGEKASDLAFAAQRGFGILTVMGESQILAGHIPFVIADAAVHAHLVRSNPIARHLRKGPVPALLAVSGPDGYISPDWYGVEDQVPTWNYVAVHVRGMLTQLADTALKPHLAVLSEQNESRLDPKPRWTMDKNAPETLDRMMRQLVPVALSIDTVDSTWKLNQNKPDDVRQRAADAVAARDADGPSSPLADLMRRRHDKG